MRLLQTSHALDRQLEIGFRRLLRLLDEAMKQDHLAFVIAEQNAGNPIPREACPHFLKPLMALHATAKGHPDRPSELRRSNIVSNQLPFVLRKAK